MNNIIFIPKGQQISPKRRTEGNFYLEERNQTSIRVEKNIPTSIRVSGNLGLKRE